MSGLTYRPHPYQLNSGRRMTKVREVNEGVCEGIRPAGRAWLLLPGVVNSSRGSGTPEWIFTAARAVTIACGR
jgi:hypothetical protein